MARRLGAAVVATARARRLSLVAIAAVVAARPMAPRTVVLNAKRLNFDGALDWSRLDAAGDVVRCDLSVGDDAIVANVVGAEAEVVVTKELVLSAAAIARFPPSVRLVIEAGTGYNNVDRGALATRNIQLRTCPAYSTEAVATLVLTHVLNFSSSMYAQQRRVRSGDRAHFEDLDANVGGLPHFELRGKTLGLVGGAGTIGSQVAAYTRAFGMRVLVSSRTGRRPEGCEAASVDDLLAASDFVSLHCPLTDATRHLVDAAALKKMKPTAYFRPESFFPVSSSEVRIPLPGRDQHSLSRATRPSRRRRRPAEGTS